MNLVRFLVLPLILLAHQNVLGAMHAEIKVQHQKRRMHEKEVKEFLEYKSRLQTIDAQDLWDDEKWNLFLSAIPAGPDKHKFQTTYFLGISFSTFVRLATVGMQVEFGQSINKKDKEWFDKEKSRLNPQVEAGMCKKHKALLVPEDLRWAAMINKRQESGVKVLRDEELWKQTIALAPNEAEREKCQHAQALGMTHATYAKLADIRVRMKTPQSFDTCVSSHEKKWYGEQLSIWLPRLLESSRK